MSFPLRKTSYPLHSFHHNNTVHTPKLHITDKTAKDVEGRRCVRSSLSNRPPTCTPSWQQRKWEHLPWLILIAAVYTHSRRDTGKRPKKFVYVRGNSQFNICRSHRRDFKECRLSVGWVCVIEARITPTPTIYQHDLHCSSNIYTEMQGDSSMSKKGQFFNKNTFVWFTLLGMQIKIKKRNKDKLY